MRYDHTQNGWFHWLIGALGIGEILLAAWVEPLLGRLLLVGVGSLLVLLAFCFAHLRIRDAGDQLEVRYGPLPLFGRSIPYRDIRSFEKARSWLVDGWGIHWLPWRGWIFNLRGRDCVVLETTRGTIRLGTDDPEGLAEHLGRRAG